MALHLCYDAEYFFTVSTCRHQCTSNILSHFVLTISESTEDKVLDSDGYLTQDGLLRYTFHHMI